MAGLRAERFDTHWKMVLDLDFYLRLLAKGHIFSGVREPLYRYRRHNSSQTSELTSNLLRFQEEWELLEKYRKESRNREWLRAEQAATQKIGIKLNLLFNIFVDLINLNLRGATNKTRFALSKLRS